MEGGAPWGGRFALLMKRLRCRLPLVGTDPVQTDHVSNRSLKGGSSGEFVAESVGVNPPAPRGGFAPATLRKEKQEPF